MSGVFTWRCEACGKDFAISNVSFDDSLLVCVCDGCNMKLSEPIRLDGCVTAGSWQSIVDAHMQAYDQWRSRMVQLAKDICGGEL